ncbi:Ephrin type-A receptor 4 [Ceratobasidium sp. AG-Ba]|nr:Ephrin type-A receptor 4 [Ceratobasidium sp. AG-Ba]
MGDNGNIHEESEQSTSGSNVIEILSSRLAGLSVNEVSVTATIITSTMGIDEVRRHLIEHGCQDITDELDLSQINSYPIASGGFGVVFRSRLRDGTVVAVKDFLASNNPDAPNGCKILKRTAREIYAWSKCNHPSILPLYGIARIGERLVVVSPWMKNGSLCLQLVSAVEYMHLHGIVHGDIKPGNIVVSDNHTPMFIDFGNAALGNNSTVQFTGTSSFPCSLRYTAPEILNGDSAHTKEGRCFWDGKSMNETLTGEVPFAHLKPSVAAVLPVVTEQMPDRKDFLLENRAIGDRLWDLLKQCWAYEPKARPSASELSKQLVLVSRYTD